MWTKVVDNAGNEAVSIKTSKEFDVGYAVEYDVNGGNETIENQRKVHGEGLALTNIKPEKEGYIFKGWSVSKDAVNSEYSSSSIYSKDESVKLYAVWSEVVAMVTIDGETTYLDSVQNAINMAGTDNAVVTLLKNEITESITIATRQNITLDLNNKTLTGLEGNTLSNYGTLTINNGGKITSTNASAIVNNGKLEINGEAIIESTSKEATIVNESNLKINKGTINSKAVGIKNDSQGELVITQATINSDNHAILNTSNKNEISAPAVKITGGTIKSNNNTSIVNEGNGLIHIDGGEILQQDSGTAINNKESGKILINSGTVTSKNNTAIINEKEGTIEVTAGNIIGKKAISSNNGTLILGDISNQVSIEQPQIMGGITAQDGTFNFYGGIIKALEEDTTIEGEITKTPRGYRVTDGEETIEGVKYKTAYLGRADVEVKIDKTEYTYTGKELTPKITVLDKDIVLEEGEDYDVTYSNNVEAGTATIELNLKGDYSGTKTSTFTINKVVLTPVATSNVKTYDGTTDAEGTIYLTGSVNNELPTVSDTYKFEFEDSKSGTNKKVNVTNIQLASSWEKNYTLSTNTLELTDGAINKAKLLAIYEGEEVTFGKTPDLKVIVTGFVNNEDESTADGYKAPTITNINTQVGTYALIPTGGEATNYTFEYEGGTLVIKENMANVTVTLNHESYIYDGKEKQPEVIVTDNNTKKALTYEKDYTYFTVII